MKTSRFVEDAIIAICEDGLRGSEELEYEDYTLEIKWSNGSVEIGQFKEYFSRAWRPVPNPKWFDDAYFKSVVEGFLQGMEIEVMREEKEREMAEKEAKAIKETEEYLNDTYGQY